jgi:phosphoribosylaminoimidazole-succinocarboxamide synthase
MRKGANMLTHQQLLEAVPQALSSVELPNLGQKISGKVRDIYMRDDKRLIITTDRVSAFDRVLGTIPFKGQVLNQLSAWWFEQTQDIVRNHVYSIPDPNATLAYSAEPLPVEVIVRGFITGVTSTSLWTLYEQGERQPYGVALPDGLKKNDPLPQPIITPTTKALHGAHDKPVTRDEVMQIVDKALWLQVENVAIALFQRGQMLAQKAGWILVDTKYEFGTINGELVLIDEVHTPDSSRYWTQASYNEGKPVNFSKEFLREWFIQQGYKGEGTPPTMPTEFVADVAERYIRAYEQLTGRVFIGAELPAQARLERNCASL